MPASDEYILEILKDVGLVRQDQIEGAKETAAESGDTIPDTLVKQGVISQMQMTQALANHAGMETYSFKDQTIPSEVIESVPREIARRYRAVPVYCQNGNIAVAISDPTDLSSIDG